MRLGQLARQLSIPPDRIVNFLGSRDIAIDSHNNARVDDIYVDLVLQEFAPGNETLRQQVILSGDAPATGEADVPSTEQESPGSPPELIKAPKIELPGLRVVGKIELPEKKKPEPPKEEETKEPAKDTPARPAPYARNPRRNPPPVERKNPVTLAREREEREKKKRMEETRQLEKQRKAAYYQKRLKPQPPTKAARLINEDVEEMPPLPPERPKTLWGRFLRWLND